MLTKRIIPCLDIKDGRVVKGVQFKDHRDAGDPAEMASYYDLEGADEIVFAAAGTPRCLRTWPPSSRASARTSTRCPRTPS